MPFDVFSPNTNAGNLKMVAGQITTVTAADTIVTGLKKIISATANLEDDPVLTCAKARATIGNQASAPASGSIIIKTTMPTATGDGTPIAATTFGKKVNFVALGY